MILGNLEDLPPFIRWIRWLPPFLRSLKLVKYVLPTTMDYLADS